MRCSCSVCVCIALTEECYCCPFICRCVPCMLTRNYRGNHCKECVRDGVIFRNCLELEKRQLNRSEVDLYSNCLRPHRTNSFDKSGRRRERSLSETSISPREPEPSLMFQMDDIESPPKHITNRSSESKNSWFLGCSHLSSNRNDLDSTQSKTSEIPRRVPRFTRISTNSNDSKPKESTLINFQSDRRRNEANLKRMQSNRNELLTTQNLPGCSYQVPNEGMSKPEESVVMNIPSQSSTNADNLKKTNSYQSELLTTQSPPSCSYQDRNENVSKPEESVAINVPSESSLNTTNFENSKSCQNELPATQNRPVSYQNPNESISKPEKSVNMNISSESSTNAANWKNSKSCQNESLIIQNRPPCSDQNCNESFSKPKESVVIIPPDSNADVASLKHRDSCESELQTLQNFPDSCNRNPYQSILNEKESQETDSVLHTVSSTPDGYSSVSLPSTPSSPGLSYASSSPATPQSPPTGLLSTSAPSVYDLQRTCCQSQSSTQKTSTALSSTCETTSTSTLQKFETLRTSDFPLTNETRTLSESSSSIETLPANILAGYEGSIRSGDRPQVYAGCSLLYESSMQDEQIKPEISQTTSSSNSKLQCPEMSHLARQRTTSESSSSSIGVLSTEASEENSDNETSKNMSHSNNS